MKNILLFTFLITTSVFRVNAQKKEASDAYLSKSTNTNGLNVSSYTISEITLLKSLQKVYDSLALENKHLQRIYDSLYAQSQAIHTQLEKIKRQDHYNNPLSTDTELQDMADITATEEMIQQIQRNNTRQSESLTDK